MDIRIGCQYCGFFWDKTVYSKESIRFEHCPKCKECKNLTIEDLSKSKIDYYAGTTPYKEEKEKPKEVILKETDEPSDEPVDDFFGYTPGSWD